jgi:hypothetical protein
MLPYVQQDFANRVEVKLQNNPFVVGPIVKHVDFVAV